MLSSFIFIIHSYVFWYQYFPHDDGPSTGLWLRDDQVERIFADRISKIGGDDVVPEYLVKWQGLSYAEATWYDFSLNIVVDKNTVDALHKHVN